jgi:hypothetical protein
MLLSTIADTDDAQFDRQIAINLKGTFNTLREAARRLRDGGAVLAIALSTDVPINKQIARWSVRSAPDDWTLIRARWIRFHIVRTLLRDGKVARFDIQDAALLIYRSQ